MPKTVQQRRLRTRGNGGLFVALLLVTLLPLVAGCMASPSAASPTTITASTIDGSSVFDVQAGRFRWIEIVPTLVIVILSIVVLLVLARV